MAKEPAPELDAIAPLDDAPKPPKSYRMFYFVGIIIGGFSLIAIAFILWSCLRYGGVVYGLDYIRGYAVCPIDSEFNLGTLDYRGEPLEIDCYVDLKNLLSKNVTIIGTRADCTCVAVQEIPCTLSPLELKRIPIKLHFSGPLLQNDTTTFRHHVLFYLDTDSMPVVMQVKGAIAQSELARMSPCF